MKDSIQRDSNIELLRVFAMMGIILHHIIVHCFYLHLSSPTYINYFGNAAFTWPVFSAKLLIPELFAPLGKVGNSIFFIVSGYFLTERGRKVNLRNTAVKLLSQLAFASMVIVLASSLIYQFHPGERIFSDLQVIDIFYKEWWFVGYYFLIVTIGALFLNEAMSRCSKELYATVLCVLLALFSFSYSGNFIDSFIPGLRSVSAGVFCYLWGGYCKKYNPLEKLRIGSILIFIVLIYAFMWLSYYNTTRIYIDVYNRNMQGGFFLNPTYVSTHADYSIVPLSLAFAVFELFRRIKIRPRAWINYLSSATFMVYLIHDNEYIRNYWRFKEDLAFLLYESPVRFCIKLGTRMLATYALGVLAYTLYREIMLLIKKYRHLLFKPDSQVKSV